MLYFSVLFITDIFRSDMKWFHHLTHTIEIWAINYDVFSFFHLHLVKVLGVAGSGLSVITSLLEDSL